MKIIAGSRKGQNIKIPNVATIEPVKSLVRNAIFNLLGNSVENAVCFDLYAGSGALGLEALSRGAKFCSFVDENDICTDTIQENLNNLNFLDQGLVIRNDVPRYLKKGRVGDNRQPMIIFLDPPYVTLTTHLFKLLVTLLPTDSIVVYLCGQGAEIKAHLGLEVKDSRCYGKTRVVLYKVEK